MRISVVLLWLFALLLISAGVVTASDSKPYRFPELLHFPEMPVSEENPVTIQGVELGRYLFYDSSLSSNYSMSCGSCHLQQFAFSDSARFSKGVNGVLTRRNSMPLFNLAWNEAFFWDGKAASIEDQVFFPVRDHNEMNLDWKVAEKRINQSAFYRKKFKAAFGTHRIDSVLISRAIAQFERTLISSNSKYDKALSGEVHLSKDEYDGFVLMNDQSMANCLHCHTADANALGTTGKFSNNGIEKAFSKEQYSDLGRYEQTRNEKDVGHFKIPSLRNIAVTAPYMHDGRFETLEEVLDFYSEGVQVSYMIDSKMTTAHQGGVHLTEEEKRKIICFLQTLTDSTFLANPNHGNPWMQK